VFDQSRDCSREGFKQFMFSLSKPKPGALELAASLSKKYRMATINNESRELNDYRINNFGLDRIFNLFVTSCYVGVRKPDERIYRLALDLTHQQAENCCFIDDRPVNIAAAAQLGFATVLVKDSSQLQRDLDSLGVRP
jgi:putative hydrolase of the HAD superfamily